MFLISVIVPIYNSEEYLSKCIDSIIQQTYQNLEIILIDDGSTDLSLQICKEYAEKDNRIKIISQRNQGPSSARNNALKIAAGDFICFVDSDDYIDKNTFKTAVDKMMTDVDMVIWGVNVFSKDNLSYIDWFNNYLNFQINGIHNLLENKKFEISVVPWNKMFRKSIIKKYNIDFPIGKLYEDNAFWWKYTMFCKKIYFLPKKLHYYNLRLTSLRGSVNNKQKDVESDRIDMVQNVYEFCLQHKIFTKNKKLLEKLLSNSFEAARNESINPLQIIMQTYALIKKMGLINTKNSLLKKCITTANKIKKEEVLVQKLILKISNYAHSVNLNQNPQEVNNLFKMFQTLYNKGKADEIITTVNMFLEKYPNNKLFFHLLGDTYYFLKQDYDKALPYYKKCIDENANDAVIFNIISDIYGYKNDIYNQLLYKQKAINS